MSALQEHINDA